MFRLPAVTAALALVALPAIAQPTNLVPTRDVSVTYRISGLPNVPPQEMRMAFSPGTGKQRVDLPGGAGWILMDLRANSAVMVMDAQRVTMAMPAAAAAAMTHSVPQGATFTRSGNKTVAGIACVEWQMSVGDVRAVNCYTDDGVLLRTSTAVPSGSPVSMEATQVTYGTIDPTRLAVPSGYTAMSAPVGPTGATPGR